MSSGKLAMVAIAMVLTGCGAAATSASAPASPTSCAARTRLADPNLTNAQVALLCAESPAQSAPAAASSTPETTLPGPFTPDPGIASGPGYPAGGHQASITAAGCTLSEQGDPSVGNRYYTVRTTLTVVAYSEITISTADVEVLGSDGSEIGSLQVMPVGSSPTISASLVVTTGTVPFTGVADQMALSGQFGPSCRVVSVAYDDGNTAP